MLWAKVGGQRDGIMRFGRMIAGVLLSAATLSGVKAAQSAATAPVVTVAPSMPIDVLRYTLDFRPDVASGSVAGRERIVLRVLVDAPYIAFSANGLDVDTATMDGQPLAWTNDAEGLRFTPPAPLAAGSTVTLDITFSGMPRRGLTAQNGALYASYFACDWMVCLQDAPGDKAAFDLNLYLPAGAASQGIGNALPLRTLPDGMVLHRWRSTRDYSPYIYAFAAGQMTHIDAQHAGTRFRYINASGAAADLSTMFAESPAIAAFLSDKAGLPMPDARYTQLLVGGYEAQEAASFSLIGRDGLAEDLQKPDEQWLIVHEMAHQWWGNLITCANWQEFWLNEGFATFMTAAWKEHRFGPAAYRAEMDFARERVARAAADGYDKPLAWQGRYPSLGLRRAVQYSKGALFLDQLRQTLGEEAFWRGVRLYTRRHAGGIVRSQDFERAMTEASGRDLTPLFAQWVYGAEGAAQAPLVTP